VPEAVNPGWKHYEERGCSPAVRAGKTLYRAGVAALDAATGHLLHEGDVDAQAECAYGRVLELISAGGGRRTTS